MESAAAILQRPLLPGDFATVPFEDATPLLRDAEALRERAGTLGYLYFRGLLPGRVVAPVRAFARAFCEEQGLVRPARRNGPRVLATPGARFEGRGWDDPRFVLLQRRLRDLPAFHRLAGGEVLRVVEALSRRPAWIASANYCWVKFPGSPQHTTRPHQDAFYIPRTPTLWTGWVPLVDTSLALGSLGVVPGSHRRTWPHVDRLTGILVSPQVRWATSPVKAGDVVLFGPKAVHCAWSNVTPDRVRLALDIRYEARPRRGTTALRPER